MTVTQVPQHLAALRKANGIRYERTRLFEPIRAMRELDSARAVAQLVRTPPAVLHSMSLYDLVREARRYGRRRTLLVLRRAGASEWVTVGELTDRQRNAAATALDPKEAP